VLFKWKNEPTWPVEWVSPNVVELFGHSAAQFISGEVSYAGCIHAEDAALVGSEVEEAVRSGVEAFEHEPYRIHHVDGSVRWLHDVTHVLRTDGEVSHFVGYVVDITARMESIQAEHELEKQLLHAQKLESLGVLAGGVAHDFNNLLTGILGEASLAELALSKKDGDPSTSVAQIKNLARRAAELTRQLLAYSGRGRFVVQPLDLSELLRDITTMLGVVISKKAVLELHLGESLPAINADRAQLQQVAMNLITNASDALGDEPGLINVTTSKERCSANQLRDVYGANVAAGLYVTLEVSDDGCGMMPEVRERLFDPFFTTKANGRGLGMSAILGIMRAHSGAIRVYSEPGQGTAFKLLFPSTEATAIPIESNTRPSAWHGAGTILVVDDEPSVRTVAQRMLKRLGFQTLAAQDGADAIRVYEAYGDEIVLVLLDMMMPVMDGRQTLAQLRRMKSDLPVVMSSGFNEQDAISRLSARGMTAFLQKPYQLSDMEAAVRRALEPDEG